MAIKGTITGVFEKTKKDGGIYLSVIVDGKSYLASNPPIIELVRKHEKEGTEIEFDTFDSKDGSAVFMTSPKKTGGYGGGFKKAESKDTSFAASYSKDIAVAMINQGLIKQTKEVDAIVTHYFDLFMTKLKG